MSLLHHIIMCNVLYNSVWSPWTRQPSWPREDLCPYPITVWHARRQCRSRCHDYCSTVIRWWWIYNWISYVLRLYRELEVCFILHKNLKCVTFLTRIQTLHLPKCPCASRRIQQFLDDAGNAQVAFIVERFLLCWPKDVTGGRPVETVLHIQDLAHA